MKSSGRSRYRSGHVLELEVAKVFREAGWEIVRGAGSKGVVDGFKVDLVASKRTPRSEKNIYIVLLQAKRISL